MKIDVHSDTWAIVKATADAALANAQKKLERPGTDIAATEHERGCITVARAILDLAEPAKAKPEIPTPLSY